MHENIAFLKDRSSSQALHKRLSFFRRYLRICSHLLNKSLVRNFIFSQRGKDICSTILLIAFCQTWIQNLKWDLLKLLADLNVSPKITLCRKKPFKANIRYYFFGGFWNVDRFFNFLRNLNWIFGLLDTRIFLWPKKLIWKCMTLYFYR